MDKNKKNPWSYLFKEELWSKGSLFETGVSLIVNAVCAVFGTLLLALYMIFLLAVGIIVAICSVLVGGFFVLISPFIWLLDKVRK